MFERRKKVDKYSVKTRKLEWFDELYVIGSSVCGCLAYQNNGICWALQTCALNNYESFEISILYNCLFSILLICWVGVLIACGASVYIEGVSQFIIFTLFLGHFFPLSSNIMVWCFSGKILRTCFLLW